MIVKRPERMTQDEEGTWWYQWPDNGSKKGIRGRCFVHTCEGCGETVINYPSHKHSRFCSKECAAPIIHRSNKAPFQGAGPLHYGWKGGRAKAKGYVKIYTPDHPSVQGKKRKYVLEHRLVMEKMLGRLLTDTERVHHKDGNKTNNDPSNLELWELGHPPGQRIEEKVVEVPLALLIELLSRYQVPA